MIVQPPSFDAPPIRTVWGLDPPQLHNRYWAAHGVQVVAQGEPSEIVRHAELYLLVDPGTLALFQLAPLMEALNWIKPQVLFVRLHETRDRGYRENVVLDEADRFVRFQRIYDASSRLARVALTPDREVAKLWQSAADPIRAWRRLRRFIPRHDRATRSIEGSVYSRHDQRDLSYFVQDLVQLWKRPDSTVARARKAAGRSLGRLPASRSIRPPSSSRGLGRRRAKGRSRPDRDRPGRHLGRSGNAPPGHRSDRVAQHPADNARAHGGASLPFALAACSIARPSVFSTSALRCAPSWRSLPLYPFIMLAIWLEDGGPFFFAHRRETVGGREFPCIKFRSMRKDAEKMKSQLKAKNQADGPQFFMDDDPRLTRVGKLLRKYNLDELPQFFNVLVGDMSVVGPRPSPRRENQYCPPWREARLSVRPGITGLWQVKRTRRTGTDFQEWIKYDIEYVERHSFWFDIKIIFQTVSAMLGKISRS